tara:strand:+ start:159 stop:752 length:594 start_codon:yes stop_codon:yes gene_type:complete
MVKKIYQKGRLSATNIAESIKNLPKKSLPSVEKWDPPFCGNLDIRIARDGTWFYLGTPIGRPELVKLFSSIIRKDDKDYFLVTPVEKVGIQVDDAPFVAVDFDKYKQGGIDCLEFTTHVGDKVIAGSKNPIRIQIDNKTQEPSPYLLVRRNLEALIDRKSFYRLVDLGVHNQIDNKMWFGVWSQNKFFPLILSKEIE